MVRLGLSCSGNWWLDFGEFLGSGLFVFRVLILRVCVAMCCDRGQCVSVFGFIWFGGLVLVGHF